MSRIIALSEAGSIALHSLILIGRSESPLNAQKISEATQSSRHHVAKVLQRLVKEGYLKSERGPKGGFTLSPNAMNLSFLEIYEAIEGKIEISQCPMNYPVCPFDKCIMGNTISTMTKEFRNYLENQLLRDYL